MTIYGIQVKKWHIAIVVLAILFVPVPTELVPEWRMQFRDSTGQPLAHVVTHQEWRSYTYFATHGYEQRCTNAEGVVVFPTRYLWSGLLSRIASPLLAEAMTLAHGGTGTSASVQVFDRSYISANYYWLDRTDLYSHNPDQLPTEGTTDKMDKDRWDIQTCNDPR